MNQRERKYVMNIVIVSDLRDEIFKDYPAVESLMLNINNVAFSFTIFGESTWYIPSSHDNIKASIIVYVFKTDDMKGFNDIKQYHEKKTYPENPEIRDVYRPRSKNIAIIKIRKEKREFYLMGIKGQNEVLNMSKFEEFAKDNNMKYVTSSNIKLQDNKPFFEKIARSIIVDDMKYFNKKKHFY